MTPAQFNAIIERLDAIEAVLARFYPDTGNSEEAGDTTQPAARPRDWLTTKEVATAHKVDAESVQRWINVGVWTPEGERKRRRVCLPATKLGGQWRIARADLSRFLELLKSTPSEELGESEAQIRRRESREHVEAAAWLSGLPVPQSPTEIRQFWKDYEEYKTQRNEPRQRRVEKREEQNRRRRLAEEGKQ